MHRFLANSPEPLAHVIRVVLPTLFLISLSSCANENSIFRTAGTTVGTKVENKTVVVDAKARPLFITSKPSNATDRLYICPDKSPDALSQAAQSGKLTLQQPSGLQAGVDFAAAEQAFSLAFRTQVTETEQVFLYYLCQLNANGALNDERLAAEMRHFQNTMLAMLAVEQLTGVAGGKVGPQTVLTPPGTATPPSTPTPSDPAVNAANLDPPKVKSDLDALTSDGQVLASEATAVKTVKTAKDASAAAKAVGDSLDKYTKSESTLAADITNFVSNVKKIKISGQIPDPVTSAQAEAEKAPATVDQKKPGADKALDDLKGAMKTLQGVSDDKAVPDAQTAFENKYTAYKTADTQYVKALTEWSKAVDKWSSAVIAAVSPSSPGGKDTSTNASTDKGAGGTSSAVAFAVKDIVQTVVWQSFSTEVCLESLFNPAKFEKLAESTKNFCIAHLNLADSYRLGAIGLRLGKDGILEPIPNYRPPGPGVVVVPLQATVSGDSLGRNQ